MGGPGDELGPFWNLTGGNRQKVRRQTHWPGSRAGEPGRSPSAIASGFSRRVSVREEDVSGPLPGAWSCSRRCGPVRLRASHVSPRKTSLWPNCWLLPAARLRRSICGPSTATHGRQLAASFRRCRVALVGHTLHSPSLSAFLTKASLTNCTTSTRGGFSGNDCPSSSDGQGGGKRRAAIPRMVAGFARGGACEELGRRAPNSSARRFVTLIFTRGGISLRRMLRFDGGSTADPNPVQNVGDQSRLKTFPRDDHRCGTAVVCSDGDSSRQGRSAD